MFYDWFVALSINNIFRIRSCCTMYQYFFPFYCRIIFCCKDLPCYFTHSSDDRTWVIYTFGLVWLMLLGTLTCKFLCGCMSPFFFGIYLGVELLSHIGTLCLTFWRTSKVFSNFITYVVSCIHHHNQDTEQSHHHKDPSWNPFITISISLLCCRPGNH